MTAWISVKERLPEPVYIGDEVNCIAILNDEYVSSPLVPCRCVNAEWASLHPDEYTHWFPLPHPFPRPLPEPPVG